MFWGWENTGVTLRRAGTGKKGREESIATVLRPFPWHPTHLNLTPIFSRPKTQSRKQQLGTSLLLLVSLNKYDDLGINANVNKYSRTLKIREREWERKQGTPRATVSYGNALTWTLVLPVWKPFTSTRNQMYASDTSRNPLQSCLEFHSILDLLLKTSLSANFYSFFDIILSYLAKNSIQRNMKRRGEKHVGTRREKSPSITKITREWINNIAEQIIVIYIWKIDGEKLHIFRKWSFLDLEPSTMIQTCHFSPLLIKYWFFEFEGIRRCLAFPGQIHR